MNRILIIFILLIPSTIFTQEKDSLGVIQIDVTVKVISAESVELWSEKLRKYTISNRSISLNLKGFDGELTAIMTPVLLDDENVHLTAKSVVKSLENNYIINESEIDLTIKLNEYIILYPIGNIENIPNVVIELKINNHIGAGI